MRARTLKVLGLRLTYTSRVAAAAPRAIAAQAGYIYTVEAHFYTGSTQVPAAWVMRKNGPAATVDFYNYATGYPSEPFGITSVNGHLFMCGYGTDSTGVSHWVTRTY